MRIIAAATLVLMPLTAAASQPQRQALAQPPAQAKPGCDRFGRLDQAQDRSVQRQPSARAQRLDRLPPADLHLTVERTVGGCHVPVIIRQDFNGAR
jgi:hypothetical protein